MFTEAIQKANEQLLFHRSKTKIFLWWVWGLSAIIFVVIIIFAGYIELLLKTVAQVYVEMNIKIANIPSNEEIKLPDFVGLINENYFGYWAVSGFILALIASLGMLKYHAGRTAYFETELLNLNRLQSISRIESVQPDLANKIIEFSLSADFGSDTKIAVNPILEALSENTSKIMEKLSSK